MTNPAEETHDASVSADSCDEMAVTPLSSPTNNDHCGEDAGSPKVEQLTWQEEHKNKLRHIISNQRKLLSQILPDVELGEASVNAAEHSSKTANSSRIKINQNTRKNRKSKSLAGLVLADKEQKEIEQLNKDAVKDGQKSAKCNDARIRNKRNTVKNRRSMSFVSVALAEKEMNELEEAHNNNEVVGNSPRSVRCRLQSRRDNMKKRRSKSFVSLAEPSTNIDRLVLAEKEANRYDSTCQRRGSFAGESFNPLSCYGFNSSSSSLLSFNSSSSSLMGQLDLSSHGSSSGDSGGESPRRRIEKSFSDRSINSSSGRHSVGESRRRIEKSLSDRSINSSSGRHSVGESRRRIEKSLSDRSINSSGSGRRQSLRKSRSLLLSVGHKLDDTLQGLQKQEQKIFTNQPGHATNAKRRVRGRNSTGQSLSTRSSLGSLNLDAHTTTFKGGRRRHHKSHSPHPQGKKDALVSQSDHSSCSKRASRRSIGTENLKRRGKSKSVHSRSSSCLDELTGSLSLHDKTPKCSNTKRDKLSRSKSEAGLFLNTSDDSSENHIPHQPSKKDDLVSQSDHSSCSKHASRRSIGTENLKRRGKSKSVHSRSSSCLDELTGSLSLHDKTPKCSNTKRDKLSRSKSEAGLFLNTSDDSSEKHIPHQPSKKDDLVSQQSDHSSCSKRAIRRSTNGPENLRKRGKSKSSQGRSSSCLDELTGSLGLCDQTPKCSNTKRDKLSRSKSEAGLLLDVSDEMSTTGLHSSDDTPRHSNRRDVLSRSKSEAGLLITELEKRHGCEEEKKDTTHVSSFVNRLDMARKLSDLGLERKTGVHEDIIRRLQRKVEDRKKSNSTQGALSKRAASEKNSISPRQSSSSRRLCQSRSLTDLSGLKQKVYPCGGGDTRISWDPNPRLKKAIIAMQIDGSMHGKSDEVNGPSISQLAGLLSASGAETFKWVGSTGRRQVGTEGIKIKKRVRSARDLQRLVKGVNQYIVSEDNCGAYLATGNSRKQQIMSKTKSPEKRLSLANALKEEAARAG